MYRVIQKMLIFYGVFCLQVLWIATRLPLEQQSHATTGRPSCGLHVPSLLQSQS